MEYVRICRLCPDGPFPEDDVDCPACRHPLRGNVMERAVAEEELARLRPAPKATLILPWANGEVVVDRVLNLGVKPEFCPIADKIQDYFNPTRDPSVGYYVSGEHAIVEFAERELSIRNRSATNPTYVNGVDIGGEKRPLVDGDVIGLSKRFNIEVRLR